MLFPLASAAQTTELTGRVFTVNSIDDTVDARSGDGICADAGDHCTLRAAIEEANASEATDAIVFSVPHGSAIELVLGELVISKGLLMAGPGAKRLAIGRSLAPGTPNFRVFRVTGTITYAMMYGITIRNGQSDAGGGGVLVESRSGLGIYDSAIRNNHAQFGGAVASLGSVSLQRCALYGNTATSNGGAVANLDSETWMTVISSTFTKNEAQTGGAIYHNGELTLANATISQNRATVASTSIDNQPGGVIKVVNTLIGRDISKGLMGLSGTFQSYGHNIITDSRGSTGFANGINGDQVSENNVIDPKLGPLTDMGGQTDVLPTLAGSPAIEAGDVCVTTANCPPLNIQAPVGTDQRHLRRALKDPNLDIGAYEGDATPMTGLAGIGYGSTPTLPTAFFVNSPVVLINPTTLEQYHTMLRLNAQVVFEQVVPLAELYIMHIKSKRRGLATPTFVIFD